MLSPGGAARVTYPKNHQHVIFSTAGRRKSIHKSVQAKVWAYLAGICRNHGIFVRTIGGADDHVHLLLGLLPSIAVAKAVNLVKSNSSKWLNEKKRGFAWQKGNAAFSVSASNVGAVTRYIASQEAHHRKMSFEDELIALLRKHGVDFDPKYVFG